MENIEINLTSVHPVVIVPAHVKDGVFIFLFYSLDISMTICKTPSAGLRKCHAVESSENNRVDAVITVFFCFVKALFPGLLPTSNTLQQRVLLNQAHSSIEL